MILLMAIATCWGVVQLAVLGLGARTLRFGTLLLAVAAGFYAAGVLAVGLQLVWTRTLAAVTGTSLSEIVQTASYTVDPVIEEVVKILPLALVAIFGRFRRQWGLTDFLLIGGAIGAGFSFVEAMLRFSSRVGGAIADGSGGFILPISLSPPAVPGIGSILTSWLPPAIDGLDLFDPSGTIVNYHLVWTALAGFGIGLAVRLKGPKRLLGLIPLLYASIDHAANNYAIVVPSDGFAGFLLDALENLRHLLPAIVLLALIAATVIDRIALAPMRARHPELLLAEERSGTMSIVAVTRFAVVAAPWTPIIALRFVMLRRAAWYALARDPEHQDALAGRVTELAGYLDENRDAARWREGWRQTRAQLVSPRALLRSWPVIVWLVLAVPAFLYFVVGGVPLTAWIQDLLETPVATVIVAVIAVAGIAYGVWQLVTLVLGARAALRQPAGEQLLRAGLRLSTGLAAVLVLVASVLRGLTGTSGDDRVVSNFHILDALGSALLITALLLGLAALFIAFPPAGGAALALAGGGMAGGGVAISAAVVAEWAAALGLSGIVMMAASRGGGSGGPDRGGRGGSGGTPRGNQNQNKQFKDAVRQGEKDLGRKLTRDEVERLHREISHQDYGFHDIVELVASMFGG